MNINKLSLFKLKKLLKTKLSEKDKKQILERIKQEEEDIQIFVNNLFENRVFKLALYEAGRRNISNPTVYDIFNLMSEIVARANEREIEI